jgi:hypothetical protein
MVVTSFGQNYVLGTLAGTDGDTWIAFAVPGSALIWRAENHFYDGTQPAGHFVVERPERTYFHSGACASGDAHLVPTGNPVRPIQRPIRGPKGTWYRIRWAQAGGCTFTNYYDDEGCHPLPDPATVPCYLLAEIDPPQFCVDEQDQHTRPCVQIDWPLRVIREQYVTTQPFE